MPKAIQSKSEAEKRPAAGALFREGVLHFSCAYFLAAMVLLIVTEPFIELFQNGILIESVLLTLVMLSALLAIGGSRSRLVWGSLLVLPALVAKWVNHLRPDLSPPEVFLGAGLLFVLFVVLHLLNFILRAPRVDSEVLCAGIANYLMLGLFWAFAFMLVARVTPDAFVFASGAASSQKMIGFSSIYYSFATLSTLGYGDIVPVSNVARMLAMTEAVVGMFYMTMLIARLVALYSSERPSDSLNNQVVPVGSPAEPAGNQKT